MIDTIKVGIPLTRTQHLRILAIAQNEDRWQWVQVNPTLGELRFVKMSGLVKTDQHSYHRELKWDIEPIYSQDSKLILEFSIPKYWYGHNIHLLYNFVSALSELKTALEHLFRLKGRTKLANPLTWHLYRVDLCYAWRLPSQVAAQGYLDSLKHIHFPRKRPVIYPTSIVFQGATYTLKFYLKRPEFRTHDMKELLKVKASIEWIDYLERLADGVLRCEATLRRKYLKVKGLLTVADLVEPQKRVHWDDAVAQAEGFQPEVAMVAVMAVWSQLNGIDWQYNLDNGIETPLKDGQYFSIPEIEFKAGHLTYYHPGGGFTYGEENKLIILIQGFIEKFLGSEAKMHEAHDVERKLLEIYKPVKAARLVSVWLYVQRFGSDKAKEVFGRDSYYRSKKELKEAGISFIEKQKLVTTIDKNFFDSFSLSVPSPHVINREDDFRDSGNILNFVPKTSGNF